MKNHYRQIIKQLIPQNLLVRRLNRQARNSILLTFDDGPHPEVTPEVLSRLEFFKARAVFFIVGNRVKNAPNLLKKIKDKGHEIGNHTFIHSNTGQPGFFSYWRDLLRCQSLIEEFAQKKPKLFRAPSGHISFTSLLVPRLVGLKPVNWSLGVQDWRCKTGGEARRAGQKLIENLKSRDIVLLHDDNPYVLDILDIILPIIAERGFDLFSGKNYL